MIVGADDAQISIKTATVVVPDYVEDIDPFAPKGDPGRINQQQVLPSAIQTRLIGNLFSNNPSSDAPGSGIHATLALPASSSGSFIFTISDNQGRELIAVPDVAFYIGEFINASTHWPNSSFGMGNMPIAVFNDWGLTNNKDVVTRAIIRNNTGAEQIVTCYCRFRIIANPSRSTGVSNI